MERNTGLFSARALANASSPHGYQSTGLCACWRRYGEVSSARRLVTSRVYDGAPASRRPLDGVQQLWRKGAHVEVLALQLLDLKPVEAGVRQEVVAQLR